MRVRRTSEDECGRRARKESGEGELRGRVVGWGRERRERNASAMKESEGGE